MEDRQPSPGQQIIAGAAGVILDLNGVLVEDEPLHQAAFTAALAPYGVVLTHETYRATILGQTDENGVARLAATSGLVLPVEAVVHAKARLYRERLRTDGPRYVAEGAVRLIAALAGRGLRLALASASPAEEVYAWLDLLGYDQGHTFPFDPVLTAESASGPKPNPAVFEAIRDSWGVDSHACVVIDDHPDNIAMAYALGMHTIAIATTLPPSAFGHTDLVVRSLAEL